MSYFGATGLCPQGVCTSFGSHLASMSREKHAVSFRLSAGTNCLGEKSIKQYLFDRLSHFTVFFFFNISLLG